MQLMGAITTTLATDKSAYLVGDVPTYRIQNAEPGSLIEWTSFKNNINTGEYESTYSGQVIGPQGFLEIQGNAWTIDDVGRWEKIAVVVQPSGASEKIQTFFTVQEKPTATATAPAPSTSFGFLDGSIDVFGQEIPKPLAYGGGLILLYWLLKTAGKK